LKNKSLIRQFNEYGWIVLLINLYFDLPKSFSKTEGLRENLFSHIPHQAFDFTKNDTRLSFNIITKGISWRRVFTLSTSLFIDSMSFPCEIKINKLS